jgi:diguanylate cyclase (GGDEF)-like protein/PAS domain S-box-containing protein
MKNFPKKQMVFAPDEQTFRLLFDGHSAIMLLIDPLTRKILDANQAAVNFYGYPKSKLFDMLIDEIMAVDPKAFDLEQNYTICSHRLANGVERILEIHSSPITLREKQVLFSIIHDITERKRAEDELVVERNLLGTLLDNLPDRIYVKNLNGQKIISNTADWQASGGKTMEAVLGKSDFDIYLPELATKFWADDQSVFNSGIPIINREEPGLDSRGNRKWVLTTKVPLRDENGEITGLVGIGRDITEYKQVKDALDESKLLFHLLIESLPQNIYAKDVDGRFVFANQHYCATQGRSLEEIVGKTDFELHPPELAEKYRLDDRRVIETGETIELEEEHEPIGGKKFFVQVIKTPFYDSKGQTAGTLGIFWDITQRKQAESELRRAQDALESAHRELQQSFEREQHLAQVDELTGINNRRSLVKLTEREFNIAMQYRPPLSVVMFDIDDFKQINDTFGHSIGDQVLQRLTQVVRSKLRSADILGRYGGDEFVILFPHTSAQEALPLAERIHASIATIRMETDKGPLAFTISVGIAQTIHSSVSGSGQSDTLENLFLRVDQALYTAKQAGKNCTVIFDPDETGAS